MPSATTSDVLDEPIFARAGEPLPDHVLDQLLLRQSSSGLLHEHQTSSSRRKMAAKRAHLVYRNQHASEVLDAIALQQRSETLRASMSRFLTKVRNDARDTAMNVVVVWDNPADRHFARDEVAAGELGEHDEDKALRKLVRESRFTTYASTWGHIAWLAGPLIVIPMVGGKQKRRRLTWETIAPHRADVVQDINDPLGHPVAVAWPIVSGRSGGLAVGGGEPVRTMDVGILDGVSLTRWRVFQDGKRELVGDEIRHDAGWMPASVLRFSVPTEATNWWLVDERAPLVQATIDICVKLTRCALTRKAQSHNLLTLIGRLGDVPKGQIQEDPEGAVVASTKQPGALSIDVKDFDTPPDSFIRETNYWAHCAVEPYGGVMEVDSGQPEIYARLTFTPDVQAENRRRQLIPATEFERTLWAATAVMLRVQEHPARNMFPESDDVEERFRVAHGTLSRALADPSQQRDQENHDISKGLTSQTSLMQQRLGGGSRDEAKKHIARNMVDQAEHNDMAARNNLPTGERGDLMTAPQANGAKGTIQREENRRAEQGEPDSSTTNSEPDGSPNLKPTPG